MNLVELIADDSEQRDAPCRFGNIIVGHACYCHHRKGPRKCPIWQQYGEHDKARWHTSECRMFETADGAKPTQKSDNP